MNVFSKVFVAGALAFTSLASHAIAQDEKTYNVTVDELWQEFKDNELKAEQKYSIAVIYIKGKVDSVGKSFNNEVFIKLSGDKYSSPILKALFKEESTSQVVNLNKGDEITILCFSVNQPLMIEASPCLFPK